MENENLEFIKELTAIIAYYKLVYVENLTKDKSLDTFMMLGGIEHYNKVMRESKEGFISLDKNNLYTLKRFNELVSVVASHRVSLSHIIISDLENMKWLDEIKSIIEPDEYLKDTICKSCSYDVYKNIINNEILENSNIYRKRLLESETSNIIALTKKI